MNKFTTELQDNLRKYLADIYSTQMEVTVIEINAQPTEWERSLMPENFDICKDHRFIVMINDTRRPGWSWSSNPTYSYGDAKTIEYINMVTDILQQYAEYLIKMTVYSH